jgi:hypothetical protein
VKITKALGISLKDFFDSKEFSKLWATN